MEHVFLLPNVAMPSGSNIFSVDLAIVVTGKKRNASQDTLIYQAIAPKKIPHMSLKVLELEGTITGTFGSFTKGSISSVIPMVKKRISTFGSSSSSCKRKKQTEAKPMG